VSENGGCVERLQRSHASLYAMATHHAGIVGVGGEEKTVFVYGTRAAAFGRPLLTRVTP
jgi:hypothetical protein